MQFCVNTLRFNDIPGTPWIYEANEELFHAFKGSTLRDLATPKVGLQTGENNKFIRLWHEVSYQKIYFLAHSIDDAKKSGFKWFPYNKGGDYRKWYGNNDYIL